MLEIGDYWYHEGNFLLNILCKLGFHRYIGDEKIPFSIKGIEGRFCRGSVGTIFLTYCIDCGQIAHGYLMWDGEKKRVTIFRFKSQSGDPWNHSEIDREFEVYRDYLLDVQTKEKIYPEKETRY